MEMRVLPLSRGRTMTWQAWTNTPRVCARRDELGYAEDDVLVVALRLLHVVDERLPRFPPRDGARRELGLSRHVFLVPGPLREILRETCESLDH